jgi:LPS O-antigen subunit length determinant protein (WzzB/FepE family)
MNHSHEFHLIQKVQGPFIEDGLRTSSMKVKWLQAQKIILTMQLDMTGMEIQDLHTQEELENLQDLHDEMKSDYEHANHVLRGQLEEMTTQYLAGQMKIADLTHRVQNREQLLRESVSFEWRLKSQNKTMVAALAEATGIAQNERNEQIQMTAELQDAYTCITNAMDGLSVTNDHIEDAKQKLILFKRHRERDRVL